MKGMSVDDILGGAFIDDSEDGNAEEEEEEEVSHDKLLSTGTKYSRRIQMTM